MHKKGFTLIELLVVASIIALLSAVTLTALASARTRATHAKYTMMMRSLETALAMYHNDHGTWPGKAGDGRMAFSSNLTGGWNSFYAAISPYMPGLKIDVPYLVSNGVIVQGFTYFKGTEDSPVQQPFYDSYTSAYIGCVKIYEGYMMNFLPGSQSSFTKNDQGVDPDGIDHLEGHYTVSPGVLAAACPVSLPIY